MTGKALELDEAREKVGSEYCSSCYIRGLIEDGEPEVVEMEVRWSLLGERPYREDIQLKCPECFDTRQKGFGLTEAEFKEKKERRGGVKMLDVFKLPGDVDEVTKENLESLGYKEV